MLHAQTSPPAAGAATREAHIYRLLFRQALAYERLASEADAAGSPKPYLRRILTIRLGLNDADAASLLRMAQGYQAEDAPLRQAAAKEKAAVRAEFPLGIIPAGMQLRPSPILDNLHLQEDSLALRYRDLLQNAMTPQAFQAMVKRLFETFGQDQPA